MSHNLEQDESLRILIVEDKEAAAGRLQRTMERNLAPVDVQIERDFNKALSALQPPRSFEAVILDLYLGESYEPEKKEGQKVWEQIWQKKLIPVVIHTGGDCDLEPPVPENNPFVKCFTKKEGSDEEVAAYLKSVRPHILALRQVEDEFNKAIHSVLADTSPLIWQATEGDEQIRPELLVRSARRRLAAMMDLNTISTNEELLSWEQYVYPPLGGSLLMGDIIRTVEGDFKDAATYRLLLTPSCDMQMNKGKCKVDSVLTAKCKHINEYMKVVVSTVKPKDVGDRLPRYLTEPHLGGYVPLPEYKSILPCMAADLRTLEVIRVDEIDWTGESGKRFKRITSVDSPFREYISWAFLQIVGRPGVPNRDFKKWTEEIVKAAPPQNVISKPTPPKGAIPQEAASKDEFSAAEPSEAVTPEAATPKSNSQEHES